MTARSFSLEEIKKGVELQFKNFDVTKLKFAEIEKDLEKIIYSTDPLNLQENNPPIPAADYQTIPASDNEIGDGKQMSDLTTYGLDQADKRAEAVEARMGRLEGKMDGIDSRLRAVETKLGEISGQLTLLVGKIPSWWQPPVSAAGLVALLVAALGILKYFKILVQ